MHAPSLRSTYESSSAPTPRSNATDFLLTHPILPVLRGLFFSSLLWIVLALTLYGVYTLITGN